MTIFKSIDELQTPYTDLFVKAGMENLYFSREWFANYVNHVTQDKSRILLFGGTAGDSMTDSVLLPMYDEGAKNLLSPRKLTGLSNFYSTRFEPIWANAGTFPTSTLESLVREITLVKPGWDIVNLSPSESNSPALGAIEKAFKKNNWAVQKYSCFKNLYLENTYGDFDSYLLSRSSKIRKTAANRSRKFDRDPSNSFDIITDTKDLERAIRLFSQLYEKRWNRPEPFPDFLPNLAKLCADNGWLRLGIASVGGRTAAAQFWIVKDRVAYIFKVAYDEEFTKMSVGSVALFKMFQHVLDNDDVREIDFLTGDEPYKRDWMNGSREMIGISAFSKRTLRGLTAACRHLGGRSLKLFIASLGNRVSTNL